MNIKKLITVSLAVTVAMLQRAAFADITVSDVKVFSGYPWKEVVVGYTITGTAAETDIIRLTATDKLENKTYTAQWPTDAVLTEGRHVLRWNAAAEDVKFSSASVVFSVSIVSGGVQLWDNGPYWAECNVGATTPEGYGYYYWWGDTIGYKRNARNDGWVSVANGEAFYFTDANCLTYNKGTRDLQRAGYIDAAGNLVAAHDAATVRLGALWRMPTAEEFSALVDNCTTTWTTRNGVSGRLVTGKGAYSSKSIFLPAAGYGDDSGRNEFGSRGYYWSSTPSSEYSYNASYLGFGSSNFGSKGLNYRRHGRTLRPVRRFAK